MLLCVLLAGAAALLAVPLHGALVLQAGCDQRGAGPGRPRTGVGSRGSPGTAALRAAAVVGTATAVVLMVPGPEGALAAAGGAALAWWRSSHWEGAAERRRRRAVEAEVPLVVDLLVAALQTGSGPAEALERVAEVVGSAARDELMVPLARLRLGADPVSVWGALSTHPQLHQLGRTLARAAETGAPVAETLERLSADLRGRRRADVEARIRQVEVKAAAPLGVCLLPAFVLLGVVPLIAGSAVHLVGG